MEFEYLEKGNSEICEVELDTLLFLSMLDQDEKLY